MQGKRRGAFRPPYCCRRHPSRVLRRSDSNQGNEFYGGQSEEQVCPLFFPLFMYLFTFYPNIRPRPPILLLHSLSSLPLFPFCPFSPSSPPPSTCSWPSSPLLSFTPLTSPLLSSFPFFSFLFDRHFSYLAQPGLKLTILLP